MEGRGDLLNVRGKCAYSKQIRNLVQETLVAKRQASHPSPGKAADTEVPVCKVSLCCLSLPSWLFLPTEGLLCPTEQGLLRLVLLLQALQSDGTMSTDTGQWLVPNNVAGAVSEATVLQTPAKLKIHSFHLTREESSRIKRELEQQTLVFLATGHSHFWENKRIEECCHFLVVCSYILKDNFTWMVWEAGIGLHLRKHTTICRQVWKQKTPQAWQTV